MFIFDLETLQSGPIVGIGHTEPIRAVLQLENGQLVSGGEDSQVILWKSQGSGAHKEKVSPITKIRAQTSRESRHFSPY